MGSNLVKDTMWTTLSTIVMAIVQILRLSILARFLDKTDFGIVAILTLILGFSQIFCDLGFATALMYKKDITRKEFSSLYWLQFSLFILMYVLFLCLSKPLAMFYEEASLAFLLPIVMIDLLFKGIGRLYEVMLQKNFRFKLMALRNIIASILSLIVAVFLAFEGYGVYSLILSTLFNTILVNVWNFIAGFRDIRLMFYCSFGEVKTLCKIGIFQTGSQILDYVSTKIDIIILGKVLGTYDLGLYNLAKELILRALDVLNGIANKVALPYFAKMQDSHVALRFNYCKLMKLLASVNIPICAMMGALSIPIVDIMYGFDYKEVAPLLSILSIWGMFVVVGNPVSNIVISTGNTKLSFKYTIFRLLLFIPGTLLLSYISLLALSWGQIFLAFLGYVLSWYMLLYKTIKLDFSSYFKSMYKSFLYFSFVVLFCYNSYLVFSEFLESNIFKYIIISCIFAFLLLVYIILIDKNFIFLFIKQKFK